VFEHSGEQLLLAAEVVIEHALVGLGATRDLVDARAEQPSSRELFGRRHQDATACTFRISFDFWLIHGGVLLCEPRDPDRHPHRLGAGATWNGRTAGGRPPAEPLQKSGSIMRTERVQRNAEIGDNQGLANLSGRAARGRKPFGAAAPLSP
jgi:hypothetical protein